jgi:hypothetical protein
LKFPALFRSLLATKQRQLWKLLFCRGFYRGAELGWTELVVVAGEIAAGGDHGRGNKGPSLAARGKIVNEHGRQIRMRRRANLEGAALELFGDCPKLLERLARIVDAGKLGRRDDVCVPGGECAGDLGAGVRQMRGALGRRRRKAIWQARMPNRSGAIMVWFLRSPKKI